MVCHYDEYCFRLSVNIWNLIMEVAVCWFSFRDAQYFVIVDIVLVNEVAGTINLHTMFLFFFKFQIVKHTAINWQWKSS